MIYRGYSKIKFYTLEKNDSVAFHMATSVKFKEKKQCCILFGYQCKIPGFNRLNPDVIQKGNYNFKKTLKH